MSSVPHLVHLNQVIPLLLRIIRNNPGLEIKFQTMIWKMTLIFTKYLPLSITFQVRKVREVLSILAIRINELHFKRSI